MWCIYVYMCVCVSFVFCHSVGSWVSLSSPNLISVESPNTVKFLAGMYMRDTLQLDKFTDASSPSSGSVPR